MKVHDVPFSWVDVGCGRDYAKAIRLCLEQKIPGCLPAGRQIKPGLWVHPGGTVSPQARISGACYVGEGARISAGAVLKGTCSVGAGSVIEEQTLLRDSHVMANTHVQQGAWADRMILHGTWAVDHAVADGSLQNRTPLPRVTPLSPDAQAIAEQYDSARSGVA